MSSVYQFWRRHRGKIVVGGAFVGLFAAARVFRSWRNFQDELVEQASVEQLETSARRHLLFDGHQRSCDDSLLQCAPSIADKLRCRLDVEASAERLRAADADAVAPADKRAVWHSMKCASATRIVALAYSFSLLVVALKTQVSMLAAHAWLRCPSGGATRDESSPQPSAFALLYDKLAAAVGASVGGGGGGASEESSRAHEQFLQALQYFSTAGVDGLAERAEAVVGGVFGGVALGDPQSAATLRQRLADCCAGLESVDARHFGQFVVPLETDQDVFSTPRHEELEALVAELRRWLASDDARRLVSDFAARFVDAAVRFCAANCEGFGDDGQTAPTAKLVPVLADAYFPLCGVDFDSVLGDILVSSELHDYTVHVFENCSV